MADRSWRPARSWVRGVLVAALVAAAALLAAAPAGAHVKTTTGYSVIRSEGGEISYQLRLEYDVLARSSGMGAAAEDARDDEARRAALADRFDVVAGYLDGRVVLYLDDVACEGGLERAGLEARDTVTYAVLDLDFSCFGEPDGTYRIHYGVFALDEGIVDDHVNLIDYELGDAEGQAAVDSYVTEFVAGDRSLLASSAQFVGLGVEHLLSGLEHILFVVALLLGASSLGSLARVVGTFTAAHSLSLALSVLGVVHLPAQYVQPLIALSLVYVAVESVIGGRVRHRLAVVFAFGLLHGLGFASAMRFTEDVSWGLVGSLAGFNLGIEIGQLLVVAVLFPLLLAARRLPPIRRLPLSTAVHLAATGVIAVMGLVWFAQRVPLG